MLAVPSAYPTDATEILKQSTDPSTQLAGRQRTDPELTRAASTAWLTNPMAKPGDASADGVTTSARSPRGRGRGDDAIPTQRSQTSADRRLEKERVLRVRRMTTLASVAECGDSPVDAAVGSVGNIAVQAVAEANEVVPPEEAVAPLPGGIAEDAPGVDFAVQPDAADQNPSEAHV